MKGTDTQHGLKAFDCNQPRQDLRDCTHWERGSRWDEVLPHCSYFFFFYTKYFPVCYGGKQSPGKKEAAVLGWRSTHWSSELSALWKLEQQNPREKFVIFLLKKFPWLGGVLLGTSFKRELDEEFVWFRTFRGSTVRTCLSFRAKVLFFYAQPRQWLSTVDS